MANGNDPPSVPLTRAELQERTDFDPISEETVFASRCGVTPHLIREFVSDTMHDTAPQGEHQGYRLPPEPIPTILDAPPTPLFTLSPDRSRLTWFDRRGLPPLAELAEPELGLAGVRINPRTNMRSRQDHLVSLSIGGVDDAPPRPVDLPEGARLNYPRWSPDSRHLAFVHTPGEAELDEPTASISAARCSLHRATSPSGTDRFRFSSGPIRGNSGTRETPGRFWIRRIGSAAPRVHRTSSCSRRVTPFWTVRRCRSSAREPPSRTTRTSSSWSPTPKRRWTRW